MDAPPEQEESGLLGGLASAPAEFNAIPKGAPSSTVARKSATACLLVELKTVKLLIIGLDAATLDLIKPWVAEGKLSNLGQLMDAGASGRLASVVPPITPLAWTSFMTGKNPGKHGIFDFLETEPGTYSLRYLNGSSRRAKTFGECSTTPATR
jgi:hypothetical protein